MIPRKTFNKIMVLAGTLAAGTGVAYRKEIDRALAGKGEITAMNIDEACSIKRDHRDSRCCDFQPSVLVLSNEKFLVDTETCQVVHEDGRREPVKPKL